MGQTDQQRQDGLIISSCVLVGISSTGFSRGFLRELVLMELHSIGGAHQTRSESLGYQEARLGRLHHYGSSGRPLKKTRRKNNRHVLTQQNQLGTIGYLICLFVARANHVGFPITTLTLDNMVNILKVSI